MNEINLNITLNASKDGVTHSTQYAQTLNQTVSGGLREIQNIATSAQALSLTNISGEGLLLISNLDATNFVDVALDNGMTHTFATLKPKDSLLLRRKTGATYYLKADTAAVNVLVTAFPN